jgi:hypothetical protein
VPFLRANLPLLQQELLFLSKEYLNQKEENIFNQQAAAAYNNRQMNQAAATVAAASMLSNLPNHHAKTSVSPSCASTHQEPSPPLNKSNRLNTTNQTSIEVSLSANDITSSITNKRKSPASVAADSLASKRNSTNANTVNQAAYNFQQSLFQSPVPPPLPLHLSIPSNSSPLLQQQHIPPTFSVTPPSNIHQSMNISSSHSHQLQQPHSGLYLNPKQTLSPSSMLANLNQVNTSTLDTHSLSSTTSSSYIGPYSNASDSYLNNQINYPFHHHSHTQNIQNSGITKTSTIATHLATNQIQISQRESHNNNNYNSSVNSQQHQLLKNSANIVSLQSPQQQKEIEISKQPLDAGLIKTSHFYSQSHSQSKPLSSTSQIRDSNKISEQFVEANAIASTQSKRVDELNFWRELKEKEKKFDTCNYFNINISFSIFFLMIYFSKKKKT